MRLLWLILIVVHAPIFAERMPYPTYLSELYVCVNVLASGSGGPDYNMAQVAAVRSGGITKLGKCQSTPVLKAAAHLITHAHDCAKTAVDIRNQYHLMLGERPITGRNARAAELGLAQYVNSLNLAEIWNKGRLPFSRKFFHERLTLPISADDPTIRNLVAGDILFFENLNCKERSGQFLGHTMTILEVRRDRRGKPKSLVVLEGHTNQVKPTYRKIKLSQIIDNGNGNSGAIYDIGCTVFRGVTYWNTEEKSRKSRAQGGYPLGSKE